MTSTSDARTTVRGATSDGVVYERRGAGRPVVLVHGWCLSRSLWVYEEELLCGAFDVVTPDLPGFGRSDGLAGPYDLERCAASLGTLLAELDLRDAVIVGFAFGAAAAMELAVRDDSRIGGLVLIGLPTAAQFPGERMARSIRRDWPDFARRSAQVLCEGKSEATVAWLEAMFRATPLPVAVETAAVLDAFEPEPRCSELRVPALFLHGAGDQVSPSAVSERCAALAPHGQVELIPECGHLAVLEEPQLVHEAIERFLAAGELGGR
jgi:pimeloyl-ACP methyl ester carboxylesterase